MMGDSERRLAEFAKLMRGIYAMRPVLVCVDEIDRRWRPAPTRDSDAASPQGAHDATDR